MPVAIDGLYQSSKSIIIYFLTHPQVGSLPPALPLLSHHNFPRKRCHALSSNHYACFVIIILLLPFENSLYFLRSCFPKAQKKKAMILSIFQHSKKNLGFLFRHYRETYKQCYIIISGINLLMEFNCR